MLVHYYRKEKSKDTDYYIKQSLLNQGINCDKVLRTENGKPYINVQKVHVGVTHTEELVIVAVSDNNFGIDAENKKRRVKKFRQITERYFFPSEAEYIDGSNEKFLEIWVKKEAYLKYTGDGLTGIERVNTLGKKFIRLSNDDYFIYIYSQDTIENIHEERFF